MTHEILILLSGLVLFSYLFDVFSRRTRIPAVLLLMGLGFLLQEITHYFNVTVPGIERVLPTLGTIGLIMIVFEGALDLHFSKEKSGMVFRSFFSALFNLLGSAAAIALLFHYYSGADFNSCMLNAIPYAVVSSAIAIPSVSTLDSSTKEFIVYESTFSDILGIMLFNFFLVNREVQTESFIAFGADIIITLLISAGFSILMLFIMGRISHHVKFFLIISMLVLIYSMGKMFHLSSLIIVLALGLLFRNAHQMPIKRFREKMLYDHYQQDFIQLHQLSAESAFLIRTFFFIIFGFLIKPETLTGFDTIEYGVVFIIFILIIRVVYYLLTTRKIPLPETLINPRGLISILLFYSIPNSQLLGMANEGLLFIVILGTSLVMTLGLLMTNSIRK
ncbi:MAG TPA: sodium:proton antiporter [Bacteroidia bacterium]|nr:sodium:proton antiporter [Bacteroidia bacterium]